MNTTPTLAAAHRDTFGKGVARKLRAAGRTPVVVYGHGVEPMHLSVATHPLGLIVRHANALIELDIVGNKQLVLVKDVQRNPVRQIIEHVDLVIVRQGETVDIEVPIVLVGEPFSGTSALQELNTLHMRVPATTIQEHIEVSVEGLEAGTQILARDVQLADDETLLGDPETLVAHIVLPRGSAGDTDENETSE